MPPLWSLQGQCKSVSLPEASNSEMAEFGAYGSHGGQFPVANFALHREDDVQDVQVFSPGWQSPGFEESGFFFSIRLVLMLTQDLSRTRPIRGVGTPPKVV